MSKMRVLCSLVVVLAVATLSCFADQLAWNSRETCEVAAKTIKPNSILVSYCSLATSDHVEVWLVKKVVVATTSRHDLFQVYVFGKCLYRSKEEISENQYAEPIEYEAISSDESDRWFLKGIDLAYIYVPTSKTSFRCLGKLLNTECDVHVETINLPVQVVKDIDKMELEEESANQAIKPTR